MFHCSASDVHVNVLHTNDHYLLTAGWGLPVRIFSAVFIWSQYFIHPWDILPWWLSVCGQESGKTGLQNYLICFKTNVNLSSLTLFHFCALTWLRIVLLCQPFMLLASSDLFRDFCQLEFIVIRLIVTSIYSLLTVIFTLINSYWS